MRCHTKGYVLAFSIAAFLFTWCGGGTGTDTTGSDDEIALDAQLPVTIIDTADIAGKEVEVLTSCPIDLLAAESSPCISPLMCEGDEVTCCGEVFSTTGCACNDGWFHCTEVNPPECRVPFCSPEPCFDDNDCPEGWVCKIAEPTGVDLVFACFPSKTLCSLCATDDECQVYRSENALCIKLSSDDRVCGMACKGSAHCPEGFKCTEVVGTDGNGLQCYPKDGQTCPELTI